MTEHEGADWVAEAVKLVGFVARHALIIGAVLTALGASYLVLLFNWSNIELAMHLDKVLGMWAIRVWTSLFFDSPLLVPSVLSLLLGVGLMVHSFLFPSVDNDIPIG